MGAVLAIVLAAAPAPAALAQDTTARLAPGLPLLGGPLDDDLRTAQLRTGEGAGWLLRSPSSLARAAAGPRVTLVPPHALLVHNATGPHSLNDAGLWAGRGTSALITFGGVLRAGRVRVALLPELAASANEAYALADPAVSPPVPARRSPFSSPWHAGAQSIDLPIRFGERPLRRLGPGQSSLVVRAGGVELGAATENEWWGPGIRNALLLSSNAEGFPHLLVRTAAPLQTAIGAVEGRWIAGGLVESAYFDHDPANDLRRVALLGVTLQPRGAPGLTIGAARAVYGPADGWAGALASFADVFRDVGHPNAVPTTDSVATGGRDQLASLFARLILPASGFETYVEVGRAEFPVSLRDFLEQPNHTIGYTAGLQWLAPREVPAGRLRIQAEATMVEQGTTYRFRPIGSWYTSHAVAQGYTHRGQPLGAAIGPGSSSQWLAVDLLRQRWQAGAYLSRVRWLEDAHSQKVAVVRGRCTHDVSLLPGVRGRASTRYGTATLDASAGIRFNRFFEAVDCDRGRDERHRSLSVGFAPRLWSW